MGKRAILMAVLLLTTPACAEDHLEPDHSILGSDTFASDPTMRRIESANADYYGRVREKLKDVYTSSVEIRMVVFPSFFPEYAVGLFSTSGHGSGAPYRIFTVTPAAQIWTYTLIDMIKSGQSRVVVGDKNKDLERLESSVPRNLSDLKVSRCETGISDALGARIVAVWHKMLLRTRPYAVPELGLDGVDFHFGMGAPKLHLLTGKVWTPARDTTTGNLVAIGEAMNNVCNKSADMAKLEKVTAELEHRLQ